VNRTVSDALNGDPLLTPADVAQMFKVDPKTVSRWARAGRLPSSKTPGGHIRFRRSVIVALLDGGGQ
jgi:excisionase family DNA binding protein